MNKILPVIFYTFFLWLPARLSAAGNQYTLRSKDITAEISKTGTITGITINKTAVHKAVTAYTEIESFTSKRDIAILLPNKQSIRFEHELYSDSLQQSCKLSETFSATATSIRWNLEITGNGSSWSSAIRTVVKYPVNNETRFWTSWGEPQFDSANCDPQLVTSLSPYKNNSAKGWLDPLVPLPFSKHTLYYGAPPFDYQDVKAGFIPFQGNLFAIPFASVLEKPDVGFSVFLSPEDNIINLLMKTDYDGTIQFERLFNRVTNNKKITFSLDLVAHKSDWRSVLNWFAGQYPGYVNPKNPAASVLGGTAAYSNFFDNFDAGKMKRMAFTVNWQASFDFPYMGMFLPPLKREDQWTRLGGGSISIKQMDDYAKRIRQQGFYVLNYFNVTEFGTGFKYPAPPLQIADSNNLWKDCSNYLMKNFPDALLNVANNVSITSKLDSKTVHGGPYYSWKDAVAVDCGDSAYQQFLIKQASRHIREIPNSFGICIDRLDWLRFFNDKADDHITWFDNKPVRSLVTSWKDLMGRLGPLMHHAGKFILVNNHYKRIDLLKHADGILDEFTHATSPLNTTAFLTINKPALGWTPGKEVIEADGGDNFFQKYLYMGVFPMCPFPGNDHALLPDSAVDKLYLDYGPLMNQLKEKSWVLKTGVIYVKDNKAKVNLFKTKKGYSIPLVYSNENTVTVVLNDAEFLKNNFKYRVYLPGSPDAVAVKFRRNHSNIEVIVPMIRGAAMLTVSR